MKMKTAYFSHVEITFKKFEGTVQGHTKFIETNTHYSGGGGKIRTSYWTGSVSGDISPVSSTTTHKYKTEFFLQEEDGSEVPIKLTNESNTFRDSQQITMYMVDGTQLIHKIINKSTGTVTVVWPLSTIISRSPQYLKSLVRNNTTPRIIWYTMITAIVLWWGWIFISLLSGTNGLLNYAIAFVFALPGYLLYKYVKRLMNVHIANGLRKEIRKWD
jgi:hypothetical protein